MIKYIRGDIFKTDLNIIAHGCNCSGGFNSGVAFQIAQKYPEVRTAYLNKFKKEGWKLGDIQIVQTQNKTIINCGTQQFYGKDGKKYVSYEAIESVMIKLLDYSLKTNQTIAIPKIGAGLAGGDWEVIESIINKVFKDVEIVVYIL